MSRNDAGIPSLIASCKETDPLVRTGLSMPSSVSKVPVRIEVLLPGEKACGAGKSGGGGGRGVIDPIV